ncbi:lytic transglycosylase [Rhodobacter xanthinilyticus]|uniref:Lytic transglycosylase n=1 Tax=Rhodobacter xanthinilyticus TaxID=1850250 RepID=A0A1D9M8X3_9RHOB|nr:lytic transglycosylase [Rhodobacter xanthinilyticus]AOZ68258.1 lytic transglycosylase [Rhodobacter xanthinilyticus]
MKNILKLSLVLLIAACGGGSSKAPRNLDNACLLAREKPAYYSAMRKTEARWGVPVHVQMATIHQESRFIGTAKTPHKWALGVIPIGRQSSAYGYSQALDATWDEYRKDTRRFGAKRTRIQDATDFMGWYMAGSSERLGISKWDARSQYLAYHEGRSGFAKGSYQSKAWLVAVADKVDARAQMYRSQLNGCGK